MHTYYYYYHHHHHRRHRHRRRNFRDSALFNPLNADLNPVCHLMALLGAHHILHVSRIRVNYALKRRNFRSARCALAANAIGSDTDIDSSDVRSPLMALLSDTFNR